MFEEILETIENDDLKDLAKELIETIPPYFYEVPASSTGKYHPKYSVSDGGLYKHTIALCRFLNYLMEVSHFTSREKDCLRIAGIMHDSRKSGTQEAYEKNKYTNFDHPLQAAKVVRSFMGRGWNDEEIELIASSIETHMGQWNTDKHTNIVLPVPKNKYQQLLHWADYLASRKNVCFYDFVETEDEEKDEEYVKKSSSSNKKDTFNDLTVQELMQKECYFPSKRGQTWGEVDIPFLQWLVSDKFHGTVKPWQRRVAEYRLSNESKN